MKALFFILLSVLVFAAPVTGFAHEGHDHSAEAKPDGHLVFAEGALHAHLYWEQGPAVGKESILRIEWRKGSDHTPVEVTNDFQVTLWMPAMGHGSAPTALQRVVDAQGVARPGVFRVSNIYFVMAGEWEVRLTMSKEDDSTQTETMPVVLEGTPHHGH